MEGVVGQNMQTARQLFGSGQDLKSDERKRYYKELLSFAREWLLNLSDDYGIYLKTLYFQGLLPERHEEGLRHWEPFLICLAAPYVNGNYVVSIFNQYRPLCALDVVDLYRVHFDGKNRPKYAATVDRFFSVVEYLACNDAKWLNGPYRDFRYLYLGFYFGAFYCLDSGELAIQTVGARVSHYVELEFEEIKDLPGSQEILSLLWRRLSSLLAGDAENPDLVYSDDFFVSFLRRMFDKKLPPSLQSKVDDIYASLPRRIEWEDGKVRRIGA